MSISTGKELIEKITDKADDFLERLKSSLNGKNKEKSDRSSSELVNKLKELEESYLLSLTGDNKTLNETVPTSLGLEKKEYKAKTDEEIKAMAESELNSEYEQKKNELYEDKETKIDKLETQINDLDIDREEDTLNAYNKKDALTKSHLSDMIMNGLTNSTINTEGLKDIEEYTLDSLKKIDENYDKKVNTIKAKIASYEKDYSDALLNYDIKYAVDLEKKIVSLKKEEEKRLQEISEYNMDVYEREEKYYRERPELVKKYYEERQNKIAENRSNLNNLTTEEMREEEKNNRAIALDKHLETMDREKAHKELVFYGLDVISSIGVENYLRLVEKYKNE